MSTATISFGLVTVPIQLYSASESQAAVSFNLLHEKCHSRLKQQYICPKDEEIVTRDQMVKGYEFAKDQYVVFTEDELKSMAEEASKTIEITEFVPAGQGRSDLLRGGVLPRPGQGRREGLRAAGRGHAPDRTLARWPSGPRAASSTWRWCGPSRTGSCMQVLHYADEVRPFSEVPVGDAVREGAGAQARRAARRADRDRRVQARELRGRRARRGTSRPSSARSRARRSPPPTGSAQGADHRPHGGAQGEPGRRRAPRASAPPPPRARGRPRRRGAGARRRRRGAPKRGARQAAVARGRRRARDGASRKARRAQVRPPCRGLPRPRHPRRGGLRALPAPARVVPRGRAGRRCGASRTRSTGAGRCPGSAIPRRAC